MKSNLLSDGTSKIRCTYVNNNVKTTGTWNSLYMLQQVTAGPAQALVNSAVSLHRTRTVNITFSRLFFCSRYMTKHITTCGRRSSMPARYCQAYSQPYFRAVSCNSSSSICLNHYRTIRTKQRRRSKASGFRKQCNEGSTTSSHEMTPLV